MVANIVQMLLLFMMWSVVRRPHLMLLTVAKEDPTNSCKILLNLSVSTPGQFEITSWLFTTQFLCRDPVVCAGRLLQNLPKHDPQSVVAMVKGWLRRDESQLGGI